MSKLPNRKLLRLFEMVDGGRTKRQIVGSLNTSYPIVDETLEEYGIYMDKKGKLRDIKDIRCDECGGPPTDRDTMELEVFGGKKLCAKCLCPDEDFEMVKEERISLKSCREGSCSYFGGNFD